MSRDSPCPSLSFATAGYVKLPTQTLGVGAVRDTAAVGNRVFLAANGTIHEWAYELGQWSPQGNFGDAIDDIVRARAFEDVSLGNDANGNPERGALLLVTTNPVPGDENHQSVLWGFRACPKEGASRMLFAVSLGTGAGGYCPSVDCMDGFVVVGRLTSSMAIIDIAAARRGWEALMAEGKGSAVVRQPGGANQKAIIQPFWLMDPDAPGGMPSNWGVGLVPDLSGTGGLQVNVAVGSLDAGLRGMPTSIQTSAGGEGSWIPRPPFVGSPGGLDTRAHVCPLTGNRGATKLAVLRGVEVSDGVSDTPTKKFLAVAMASGNTIVVVD